MPTTCDHPPLYYNCVLYYNFDLTTYHVYNTTYQDATTYCANSTYCDVYTYRDPASGLPTTTCGRPALPTGRHHQPCEGGAGGYTPLHRQEEGCPGPRATWWSLQAPPPPGKGATWPPTAAPLPM